MFKNLVLNIEFLIDDVGGGLININAAAHKILPLWEKMQT